MFRDWSFLINLYENMEDLPTEIIIPQLKIFAKLNGKLRRGCTKRRPCAPLSAPKKERLLELSADDDSKRRTILEYFGMAKKERILELR